MLEHGGTVIISSSSTERVQKAVERLLTAYPSAEGRVSGHACDLGNEANIDSNIKQLFEKVGQGLDHVVHTAGDSLAVAKLSEIEIENVKKAGS